MFVLKFYLAILQRLKEENEKNSKSSQIETELIFEIDDKWYIGKSYIWHNK